MKAPASITDQIAADVTAFAERNFRQQFAQVEPDPCFNAAEQHGIAHSPAIGEFALKESVRLKAKIAEYEALLSDCLEYLEPLQDVRDGSYGAQEPNTEMSLCTAIKMALGELP